MSSKRKQTVEKDIKELKFDVEKFVESFEIFVKLHLLSPEDAEKVSSMVKDEYSIDEYNFESLLSNEDSNWMKLGERGSRQLSTIEELSFHKNPFFLQLNEAKNDLEPYLNLSEKESENLKTLYEGINEVQQEYRRAYEILGRLVKVILDEADPENVKDDIKQRLSDDSSSSKIEVLDLEIQETDSEIRSYDKKIVKLAEEVRLQLVYLLEYINRVGADNLRSEVKEEFSSANHIQIKGEGQEVIAILDSVSSLYDDEEKGKEIISELKEGFKQNR